MLIADKPMLMPGKDTDLYKDVRASLLLILEGKIISLDPSVGSSSSMPGYAVYDRGEFVCAGVLNIPLGRPLPERLHEVARQTRKLYKTHEPDLVVYEDIPSQRYGGGNAEAHASLLKAVGAILSLKGPRAFVRAKPIVWKRLARSSYVKGDAEDAIEMGYITISVAREIARTDPSRSYSKRMATGPGVRPR